MQMLRLYFNKLFVPIAILVSKIKRPDPQISSADVDIIRHWIRPGDALFSRTEWELSNFGLPGFYKHAAIWTGKEVWEATTKGVYPKSLEEFCFKKDGVAVGRLAGPDWTVGQLNTILCFLEDQLGEPYDFSFSWATYAKWYCSKLVLRAYQEAEPTSIEAIKTMRVLGETEISPQDLCDSLHMVVRVGICE